MKNALAAAVALALVTLAVGTGCATEAESADEPSGSVEQRSRFWPGCDGMDPTLNQCASTFDAGGATCTFAKADFDKCTASDHLHRFVGVTVTYSCTDGSAPTKKYVTGLTRGDGWSDSDQKQYETGASSCEHFSSSTNYNDISAINAIMPGIQNDATPLWQLTFLLPVELEAPCWQARRRCVDFINNTTEDNGKDQGVAIGKAINGESWAITNKCSWDYHAGECRAALSNVDYECGLRCGASVSCRNACYSTVNDHCKTSSWVGC